MEEKQELTEDEMIAELDKIAAVGYSDHFSAEENKTIHDRLIKFRAQMNAAAQCKIEDLPTYSSEEMLQMAEEIMRDGIETDIVVAVDENGEYVICADKKEQIKEIVKK